VPTTYVFAGGGTGGHIFPGVAVAQRVAARDPGAVFHFVVSTRSIDRTSLAGVTLAGTAPALTPVHAFPPSISPRPLLRFLANWGRGVRECRGVLREAGRNGPVAMAATGGFVSAPAAQAARVEGVPLVLVNLDAVPGKANRWIARRATACFGVSGGKDAPRLADCTPIPPIVREGLAAAEGDERARIRTALGLDPAVRTLLVTGGSQGAGSINNLMSALAATPALKGWQVLHQTGKEGADAARGAYAEAGVRAIVAEFVDDLASWWRASDLAVARSGAGNVAEAWATRTPAFFLPYPYHRDEHQKFNAAPLVEAGGALVEKDRIGPEKNLAGAGRSLAALLADPARIEAMRGRLTALGPADGAERVAAALVEIAARR